MPERRWRSSIVILALAGVAAGAIAQDRPESILPPGFDQPAPAPAPAPAPPPRPVAPPPASTDVGAGNEGLGDQEGEVAGSEDVDSLAAIEDDAEQELAEGESVGTPRSSSAVSFGNSPWGRTRAPYLKSLMRGLESPSAIRWGHIGLRNALLAPGAPPPGMSRESWISERAWLLLRMGEADAARLLMASIDKGRYDGKVAQIALQTALATSDIAAMCPVPSSLDDAEPTVESLVGAMCAALSGQPEIASDAINRERRRGRMGGIDLALAEKLVGAGSATARAVTLEWEPVTGLTAWRYGLATATGVALPERLVDGASPQLVAWYARAPLLTAEQRLPAARTATGMGVFSGQALTDLYAQFYDGADADAIAGSEALTLRRTFVGADISDRLEAMRALWQIGNDDPLERRASRALVGRAAARLVPNAELEDDVNELIASMFAVGLDDSAARWVSVLPQLDEGAVDPAWAMLAAGARDGTSMDLSRDRVDDFTDRDDSLNKRRSKALVAALSGLGRINAAETANFEDILEFDLSRTTKLTRDLSGAADRGEAATVMLIAAVALQGETPATISPLHLHHIVRALRLTGQDYLARMIAAEAMAPA